MAQQPVTAADAAADPLRAFSFVVDIGGGVDVARFSKVSEICMEVDVCAYREGGDPAVRYLPGQVQYSPIVLEYGMSQGDTMWDWLDNVAHRRENHRRTVAVRQLDSVGVDELQRFTLFNAFPYRWCSATLDAMSKCVAIASLALVYERIERDTSGAPTSGSPPGSAGA